MNDHKMFFGEVYYYFRCKIREQICTLVMVSVYSSPDPTLYADSAETVLACKYGGDSSLIVIDFTSIISVVGMVPRKFSCLDVEGDWQYVVEKPGLDLACLGGTFSDNDSE